MKRSDYNFNQPYIKESLFRINNGFKNLNGSNTISMQTKANTYTSYQEGQEEEFAVCGLTVEVGDEKDEFPFFVKVTMEAKFSWHSKTKEEVEAFLKVNAPSLLTGYIRPIITFLTSNSPYPPFNLSFINFSE